MHMRGWDGEGWAGLLDMVVDIQMDTVDILVKGKEGILGTLGEGCTEIWRICRSGRDYERK